MLTQLAVYSAWRSAPALELESDGRAETDLIQIRNIDGLDPVKATINTSLRSGIDGASFVGSSVEARNILLTLHPNPDWNTYTFASLRRLLNRYFTPKQLVRLVFTSDDIPQVDIYGYTEDVNVNMFSKDPELVVSIICPDPYFKALVPTVVTGVTDRSGGATSTITYNGSVPTGFKLKLTSDTGSAASIEVQIGVPLFSHFLSLAIVDTTHFYEMNSIPMEKYSQSVDISNGVITNLLDNSETIFGSEWPVLEPGDNKIGVFTDAGAQDWELTYFERHGSL